MKNNYIKYYNKTGDMATEIEIDEEDNEDYNI